MIDFFIKIFQDVPAWLIATKQFLDEANKIPYFSAIATLGSISSIIGIIILIKKIYKWAKYRP